jgi:hypothetical protein
MASLCSRNGLIVAASILGGMATTFAFADDAKKPQVLVTISKETTYITEPLRLDGYPDYVAALNQRCSAGVTPENNSAVLFWKAIGPSSIAEKYRAKYFQMLCIPPLPEKDDYFITSDAWFERQKAKEKPDTKQSEDYFSDPLWEQHSQAVKRPWSKEEFPIWAEWLALNEKPLALLVEASKRPRRYDPLIAGEKDTAMDIFCCLNATLSAHRDVTRALAMRAMLQLHEGKVDQAWSDLLACHRFGRLMGQGPTFIDFLVGITMDSIACAGDQHLMQYVQLTATQAMKMRDDLSRLPSMSQLADKIECGERFFGLDSALMVAREGPSSLWKLAGGAEPSDAIKTAVDCVYSVGLDWDIILRVLNSWYDRMADAIRKPAGVERQKAMKTIQEDIRKLQASANDLVSLGLMILIEPRKAISERFGTGFVMLLLPATTAGVTAEDRCSMQFELTKLAFVLAAYRADHDAYPIKLTNLVPKYVANLPKDIFFNDSELHYRQESNGYVLYSVGMNGKDDGGNGLEDVKERSNENWDDLVVRMPIAKQEKK